MDRTSVDLASLVVRVLPGWRLVPIGSIQVEDKSGEGGGRTYKVTALGANPPVVALHLRSEQVSADPISESRMACAARLFAGAGLAPARLVESTDWFIERWEGSGEPSITAARSKQLGELVARIHTIPTSWFDVWREKLCNRLPALRKVPVGSHVWFWTARNEFLSDLTEDCRRKWLEADFFAPASTAAARLVTAHADLHPGNMLETVAGLRVLDFDYTCVTHAVQDLSFVIFTCCDSDLNMKRAFIIAYLSASGFPTTEQDVEAILFDCEIAVLGIHLGPLDLWSARDTPERWLKMMDVYRAFVQDARASVGLRQHVIVKGVKKYVRELKEVCVVGAPVLLCNFGNAPNERFVANQDGTISVEAMRCLVLGVDAENVILVERSDRARRLVFRIWLGVCSHSAGLLTRARSLPVTGTAPVAAGAGPASLPIRLILDSHPGQGLVTSYLGDRLGHSLKLGPAEQAICVVFDGPFILCRQNGLAVHVGDPQQEMEARLNNELYEATERGDVAAMQELIARGADVNKPREYEPLGHAAAREGHLAAIEVLLSHGYFVNTGSSYGGSALVEASTYGHVDCVRRLLCVPGIDLHLKDDERTALEWARDPSNHIEPSEAHAEIAALLESAERGLLPISFT